MAFNMKRPIIKGTSLHKASIAKAKSESIVSQARVSADSSLVGAGELLGESYIPAAIDFSIDQKAIKIPESEGKGKGKKKSKTDGIDPTNKTGMVDVMINGVKTSVAAKDRFKYESVGRGEKKKGEKELTDEQKAAAAEKLRKENLKKEYDKEHPGGTVFPDGKTYDANGKEIKQKKVKEKTTPTDNATNNTVVEQEDQNTTTTRTREQKENDKIYNDFRTSKYKKKKMIEGGYTPIQSKSPMEMRDDRIYRNARADGPVRRNMIKGGYKPQ